MGVEALLDDIIRSEQHSFENEETYKEKLCEKYGRLLNHLDTVQKYCRVLAYELVKLEEYELAHEIVIAGQTHDMSKFYGDEWKYLCEYNGEKIKSPNLEKAVKSHVENNFHHPEAWGHKKGIHSMSDASLGELVADWLARADEFKRPIDKFLNEVAFNKYKFSKKDECFKKMNKYFKLITGRDIFDE